MRTNAASPIKWLTPIALDGDSELQIAELSGPLSVAQARRALLHGQIYAIGGFDHARGLWAGYAGMSSAEAPGRAWDSYQHWTRGQPRFAPSRVALLTGARIPDDELKVMEARVIRSLSARGLYMYNTQLSAREASRRLGGVGNDVAARGDQVASAVFRDVFRGLTNPLDTPAHSLRESAVRVILSADRALDTWEVISRLRRLGVPPGGRTPDRTIRRDLTVRELDTSGTPRVASGYARGRSIYWAQSIPAHVAIADYEARQCRPRWAA